MKQVEMIKQIHEFISHPTIILTAYDFADIKEEVRNIGVTSFCSKPIFLSELQRSITKQVQHKKKALDAGMNGHIAKPVNVDLLEQKLTEKIKMVPT